MRSVTTRALLGARINAMLSASAPASHWVAGALDEALTATLEEYSRAKPDTTVYQYIVPAGSRQFAVPSFATGLLSVIKVWYPYTAAAPEYPPSSVRFEFYWIAGVPYIFLKVAAVPDGTQVASIFYNRLHFLSGLAGAGTTTFSEADDTMLVVGACGYACLQRSTELDETLNNMAISTPNYGALAGIFLDRFHLMLYDRSSRGVNL